MTQLGGITGAVGFFPMPHRHLPGDPPALAQRLGQDMASTGRPALGHRPVGDDHAAFRSQAQTDQVGQAGQQRERLLVEMGQRRAQQGQFFERGARSRVRVIGFLVKTQGAVQFPARKRPEQIVVSRRGRQLAQLRFRIRRPAQQQLGAGTGCLAQTRHRVGQVRTLRVQPRDHRPHGMPGQFVDRRKQRRCPPHLTVGIPVRQICAQRGGIIHRKDAIALQDVRFMPDHD
jgi:hypothetical protein